MHFNLYNGEPLGDVSENNLQEIKQNLKKLVEVEYVTWKEKAEIECFHKIDIFEEALIREGTWGYQFEESLERFQNTSWDELCCRKTEKRLALCQQARSAYDYWRTKFEMARNSRWRTQFDPGCHTHAHTHTPVGP